MENCVQCNNKLGEVFIRNNADGICSLRCWENYLKENREDEEVLRAEYEMAYSEPREILGRENMPTIGAWEYEPPKVEVYNCVMYNCTGPEVEKGEGENGRNI